MYVDDEDLELEEDLDRRREGDLDVEPDVVGEGDDPERSR